MENVIKKWLFANVALSIGCTLIAACPYLPLPLVVAAVSMSVPFGFCFVGLIHDAVEEAVILIKERKQ